MLKKQKKQVFVFGIVAILGILLATPIPAAALDIEGIYMTSYKDHLDGTPPSDPWYFEVDIHLVDTGSLAYIDMTLPDGFTTYPLDTDDGNWGYGSWPTSYPTLTALQAIYPTGLYTFDFLDSSRSLIKSVQLDYSGIPEPSSPVDFTYPSYNGQTGISTNPTFTWTVDSGAGHALSMSLVYDYEEIYWDAPVPMETLSWQPGLLEPQYNYWLEVSVCRIKDGQPGPALPTMTVDGDVFEYGLAVDYCNEIEFTTAPAIGPSSGWVFMPDIPDIGYYLDEGCWLYFYSSVPVLNYNITKGEWDPFGPVGLIYVSWPFLYEIATGSLWFALPPESGLWVYHFCMPRIIPVP